MTTDLATSHRPHDSLKLAERDRDAAEADATGLQDAKAGNTRRSCASAWRRFQAWDDPCGHRTHHPPPPSPGPLSGSGQPVPRPLWRRPAPPSPFSAPPQVCRRPTTLPATRWWPMPWPGSGKCSGCLGAAAGNVGIAGNCPQARRPRPGHHWGPARRRAQTLRSRRPHLGDVELWADGTGRLTVQGERTRWNRQRWQCPRRPPGAWERFGSPALIPRLQCSVSSASPWPTQVRATARPAGLGD